MFRLFSLLMFKLKGWRVDDEFYANNGSKKFILVGGPHTSNWDAVYFTAATQLMKIKPRFLIKKEWMRFPLNWIFGPLGGLAIDRAPTKSQAKISMVSVMVDLFKKTEELIIAIALEGTRSYNSKWKTGFYYAAREANVPILLGYLDYKTKIAGIAQEFTPTGDLDKDMTEISKFYSKHEGKNKELFASYKPRTL